MARKKSRMVNWPPPSGTYPPWPPSEISELWLSCSDVRSLVFTLRQWGFSQSAPTAIENTTFFNSARCDHNHQVIGRMLISPDGLRRYPFSVCNNASHRDLLVLWPPFYAGFNSGVE